jgi:hypothetical protein
MAEKLAARCKDRTSPRTVFCKGMVNIQTAVQGRENISLKYIDELCIKACMTPIWHILIPASLRKEPYV